MVRPARLPKPATMAFSAKDQQHHAPALRTQRHADADLARSAAR